MIPDNKTPDAVAYDAIESSLDDFVRWLDLFPDRDVLDYQWPSLLQELLRKLKPIEVE